MVAVVLAAAFALVLARGIIDSLRTVTELIEHGAVPAKRSDAATTAGAYAEAFRRFGRTLGEGTRFALVFGDGVDRDERTFLTLFGGYYLYPAIAVSDPRDADGVMVFGAPSGSVLGRFDRVAEVDGVRLGWRK